MRSVNILVFSTMGLEYVNLSLDCVFYKIKYFLWENVAYQNNRVWGYLGYYESLISTYWYLLKNRLTSTNKISSSIL